MAKYIWLFFGMVFIFYGIIILQTGSGTMFWCIWEMIGIFCLLWSLGLQKGYFMSHKKLEIIGYGFLGIGMISLVILCSMILSEFHAKGTRNLDYIIVLGAQVREDGPSTVLKYRLDAAMEYLQENPDTLCIVSGGQGANETCSEAEGMADYLQKNGIEETRILLEKESKNTLENIANSKVILGENYNGVGIITNNFHMFRALQLAKAQGLENVYGIAADSTLWYLPNNMLRECMAILKNRIKILYDL